MSGNLSHDGFSVGSRAWVVRLVYETVYKECGFCDGEEFVEVSGCDGTSTYVDCPQENCHGGYVSAGRDWVRKVFEGTIEGMSIKTVVSQAMNCDVLKEESFRVLFKGDHDYGGAEWVHVTSETLVGDSRCVDGTRLKTVQRMFSSHADAEAWSAGKVAALNAHGDAIAEDRVRSAPKLAIDTEPDETADQLISCVNCGTTYQYSDERWVGSKPCDHCEDNSGHYHYSRRR